MRFQFFFGNKAAAFIEEIETLSQSMIDAEEKDYKDVNELEVGEEI